MLKEREGNLEVVVEIDGSNQPILAQVDIDSIFSLRSSLAHALCLPKPVEGPLMVWDKESRLPCFASVTMHTKHTHHLVLDVRKFALFIQLIFKSVRGFFDFDLCTVNVTILTHCEFCPGVGQISQRLGPLIMKKVGGPR